MIFTRTNQGLSNLKLFKGVDIVIFCEGGGPLSVSSEDALSGKHFKFSDDIRFWRPLFARLRPGLGVSFRAVGTKDTLKAIARRLTCGTISGVCVVMDRDFDELFEGLILHHRVLYTHKYSWESDLLETRVILHAFQRIAISEVSNRTLERQIRPVISKLFAELRHFVRADVILSAAGRPLFPRKNPVSVLGRRHRLQPPALDIPDVKNRLAKHHAKIKGFFLIRPLASVSERKHCFGKLCLAAAIQILHYLNDRQKQPSLANVYCKKFLVQGCHTWIEEKPGSATARYYSRIVAAV